jgi:hypothetical protein
MKVGEPKDRKWIRTTEPSAAAKQAREGEAPQLARARPEAHEDVFHPPEEKIPKATSKFDKMKAKFSDLASKAGPKIEQAKEFHQAGGGRTLDELGSEAQEGLSKGFSTFGEELAARRRIRQEAGEKTGAWSNFKDFMATLGVRTLQGLKWGVSEVAVPMVKGWFAGKPEKGDEKKAAAAEEKKDTEKVSKS